MAFQGNTPGSNASKKEREHPMQRGRGRGRGTGRNISRVVRGSSHPTGGNSSGSGGHTVGGSGNLESSPHESSPLPRVETYATFPFPVFGGTTQNSGAGSGNSSYRNQNPSRFSSDTDAITVVGGRKTTPTNAFVFGGPTSTSTADSTRLFGAPTSATTPTPIIGCTTQSTSTITRNGNDRNQSASGSSFGFGSGGVNNSRHDSSVMQSEQAERQRAERRDLSRNDRISEVECARLEGERKEPNEAREVIVNTQQDTTCGLCQDKGHAMRHCLLARDGDIPGCVICNTTNHEMDSCSTFKVLSREAKLDFLVTQHANLPPLRTTVPWEAFLYCWLKDTETRSKPLPDAFPRSMEYSQALVEELDGRRVSWLQDSFDKSNHDLSKLPRDRKTQSIEAVWKYYWPSNGDPQYGLIGDFLARDRALTAECQALKRQLKALQPTRSQPTR